MAKMNIDIPGLEVKLGKGRLAATKDSIEIPIEIKVVSLPRFLWYVVTTEYDVKWHQWPHTLYVIAKTILLNGESIFNDATASG